MTPALSWHARDVRLPMDRPIVMGILNVTPDSFSDGGRFTSVEAALARAEELVAEGADILDVGGESTRPQGAEPVSEAEERRRVVPVVEAVVRRHPTVPVSVDTVKGGVARAALDAGARIINDVSAFRLDPQMGEICAAAGAGVVLMHSRGDVSDMATYAHADYGTDPVEDVLSELAGRVAAAEGSGVARRCIAVDPGLGFAKRPALSLQLLAQLGRLAAWELPVLVGPSRKRFVGELTRTTQPAERAHGTAGACVAALYRGARIFRVHDVRPVRHALDVAWAVELAGGA